MLATFTVTNLDDVGAGSLRDSIGRANATPGADTIQFATSLADQTLVLGGTEMLISDEVTIDASTLSGSITIDASAASRIFHIDSPGITDFDVTLRRLTLTNAYSFATGGAIRSQSSGTLTLDEMEVSNSHVFLYGDASSGGAILSRGKVVISNSSITGNSAGFGGAVFGFDDVEAIDSEISNNESYFGGGGINALGNVILSSSTLSGNATGYGGGGAVFANGDVDVSDSTISDNNASSFRGIGGGIYARGSVSLTSSTVRDNAADSAGGLLSLENVHVEHSTISGNRARSRSGGGILAFGNLVVTSTEIANNSASGTHAMGGGIYASGEVDLIASTVHSNRVSGSDSGGAGVFATAAVRLESSTVSGNQASGTTATAGGIAATSLSLANSTVTRNWAYSSGGGVFIAGGTANLDNSILAGNSSYMGEIDLALFFAQSVTANRSLIGSGISLDAGANNIVTNDPRLADLNDNGGPTATHALLSNSPAIDAGPSTSLPGSSDQRGAPFVRQSGVARDIGAIERQMLSPADLVVTSNDDNGDFQDHDVSLREAIGRANGSVGEDVVTFAASMSGETIRLNGRELRVDGDLSIDASGLIAPVIVDAGGQSRVLRTAFDPIQPMNLTISGLHIINGYSRGAGGGILADSRGTLTVIDSEIRDNATDEGDECFTYGGGVYAGDVVIVDSRVSGNTATANCDAGGGGIYSTGTVSVTRSHISDNTTEAARARGGGIFSQAALMSSSRVIDNHAGYGGGVFTSQSLNLSDSTVDGNQADIWGGGILADGTLEVTGSTISNNEAGFEGGGIYSNSSITVATSTVSGNLAVVEGGGIRASHLSANSTTITDNTAFYGGGVAFDGSMSLSLTIIAGNEASGAADPMFSDIGGPDNVFGVDSIIGVADITDGGTGNQIGTVATPLDPRLGPLRNNGGPTLTHRPFRGSPAIDASDFPAMGFDQRGAPYSRVTDGDSDGVALHDVGAVEWSFREIAFVADRADNQVELFRSDGTNGSGTGILKNIGGQQNSQPHELTVVVTDLYFAATGADGEVELFRTQPDGVTRRVIDLAGTISSDPHELTAYQGMLYFVATGPDGNTELYKTDGTNTGTSRVKNLSGHVSSDPAELTILGDRLYFSATSNTGQRELYTSDGTGPGTHRVFNLYGESTSSDPQKLTAIGNTIYFVATTPSGNRELHKSDGTAAGTTLVANIAGSLSSEPRNLTEFDGAVFFTARDENGQFELWRTDGTSAGTSLVRDLSSGNSNPRNLTVFDDRLFFTALTENGQVELHVSDGTAAGTQLFVDLHGATNAFPQELTVVRETMFFSAVGSDDERELYSSDGTPDGTGRLKDFAGIASSSPHNLTAIDDILYFSASLSTGESELFMSDGTSAGTGLVKNLAGNPDPREIVAFVPSFEASRNLPIDPNVEIAERPKSIANRDRESRSRDLIANIFQQTNWQ